MGLADDCQQHFGTTDLYAVLEVARDASTAEIKKRYRRLSLKHHPDRHESDSRSKEEMTRVFQTLSKVHFILSDADKRAFYDSTGMVDNEDGLDGEADWNDYFRALFPKVTKKGELCRHACQFLLTLFHQIWTALWRSTSAQQRNWKT